jgi:hypothetical protein
VFISVDLNPFIWEVLIARELARNVFVTADSKLIAGKCVPAERHTRAKGEPIRKMPGQVSPGNWGRAEPGIEEAEKEYHRIRKGGGWGLGA